MKGCRFFIAYVLLIFIITIVLALKPDYNWDMLPYMAIIEKMDGIKSFDQIHSDVYNTAKKNLPPKKYNVIADSNDRYRKKMLEDAMAFEKQLPFFDVKPVYLFFAFILYKIGVSLTYATALPSLISYFFINLVSFFWCKKFNLSSRVFIFFLGLICIITIPLATRSNPDTLACLFLLCASYFFMETDNLLACVLFLILSILTRPENIIFSFLLFSILVAGKWKKKTSFFVCLICCLLMATVYYTPLKIMSYPGWSNLFYHAFIDNTVDPSLKQTITIPMYLKVINHNVLTIKGIVGIICLIILSAAILLQKSFKQEKYQLYKLFYSVVISWLVIKTLLFPMPGLRFVIPPVLLIIFSIIKAYELKYKKIQVT